MKLLEQLSRDRKFRGSCPHCGENFALADAQLFSLEAVLPEVAVDRIAALKNDLKAQRKQLAELKQRMTSRAALTTEAVNLGKICEKIAPSFASFPYQGRDCRCLWEPIDYIVFTGLSTAGKVDAISFLEIKTGNARLTKDQRAISEVVKAGRVQAKLLEPMETGDG
jgi:predicted Holliday junction resolvase-like endonuclease